MTKKDQELHHFIIVVLACLVPCHALNGTGCPVQMAPWRWKSGNKHPYCFTID